MVSADLYPSLPPSPARIESIVLRNTLRYALSEKEYKTLHEYLLTRSPKVVRRKAPPPSKYKSVKKSAEDYNASAIRASFRVYVASHVGLKIWDLVKRYLLIAKEHRRWAT